MTLPALAQLTDLEARLGEDLTGVDATRAQVALDDASTLIRAETGADFTDPDDEDALDPDMPAVVAMVCVSVAERAYRNPNGYRSEAESLGSYSHSGTIGGNPQPGVYLTTTELRLIRKAAGAANVTTVELRQAWAPYDDDVDTGFVYADDGGDALPWTRIDDPTW